MRSEPLVALTMTRTRTQTALTHLAKAIAAVHGELALLDALGPLLLDSAEALERRRAALLADRAALYLTLRQFDEALAGRDIGTSPDWLKACGAGNKRRLAFAAYLEALGIPPFRPAAFERIWRGVRALCR